MFIKKLKTSVDLNPAQSTHIAEIVHEVKQHGFYSAYCVNLVPDLANHTAQIAEIKALARRANLQVTFNAEESICIFEI